MLHRFFDCGFISVSLSLFSYYLIHLYFLVFPCTYSLYFFPLLISLYFFPCFHALYFNIVPFVFVFGITGHFPAGAVRRRHLTFSFALLLLHLHLCLPLLYYFNFIHSCISLIVYFYYFISFLPSFSRLTGFLGAFRSLGSFRSCVACFLPSPFALFHLYFHYFHPFITTLFLSIYNYHYLYNLIIIFSCLPFIPFS